MFSAEVRSSNATSFTRKQLFGGAISCEVPSDWIDLSTIRQVPDHQECYLEAHQGGERLLVIEILEHQNDVTDATAASYYFHDLAQANGISSPQDLHFVQHSTQQLSQENTTLTQLGDASTTRQTAIACCHGVGFQKVAMGRDFDVSGHSRRMQQEIRWIRVDLCVLRLDSVQTDILITLSTPTTHSAQVEQAAQDENGIFQRIFASFQIHDWGLFG